VKTRTLKIVVEYEGAGYHGWQRQKDLLSVQQVLEESIKRITGERVVVVGSGRTDAGVHALNQVAHFKTASTLGLRNLLLGINSLLPFDVVVKELQEADELFHARFDVKSKVYMYQIFNSPLRSALYRHFAWHVHAPLNLIKMEEGLSFLKGSHDFSSLCGKKKDGKYNCVRNIHDARIEKTRPELIRIYLEANGFLRYMVRTIAGILIEVGMGKRAPGEIPLILDAKDRTRAGITAPPHGLFLMEVKY
jgi:tRNA pseudouridine38-40 synthase